VREDAIVRALSRCEGGDAARLDALQARLGCGTQCGSCLPRVQALVRQHPPVTADAPVQVAA